MGRTMMIVRRECDKQMAEKLGIRAKCRQNCKFCTCCIEVDGEGQRRHWSPSREEELFSNIPKKGEL